ncbi:MAG: hypothetical protein M1834_006385 [Cirrosporium novae-zelandiae]|nr:MAG: hypothetical protein M1834_006385 [Cirrosporium novae-zelandiae]
MGVPEWTFFVAKYFGSGVIIATAFIHLLAPANEALTDDCLTGPITEYSWVEGIVLMTVMIQFFVELMVMRYASFGSDGHDHEPTDNSNTTDAFDTEPNKSLPLREPIAPTNHQPGEDHLGHSREHPDDTEIGILGHPKAEDYAAQMTAIFILEFGIIFHSIFIGLTLAVSGKEFNTLYVVLVFHQTFEGLGLGSRLAASPWPKSKRWTPYILAMIYGLTTPIAIAIGLGLRNSYSNNAQKTLIVNGVFDSISAGILIYTGVVELLAHEFLFSPYMRRAKMRTVMSAYGLMCLGAGLMALLGKWA